MILTHPPIVFYRIGIEIVRLKFFCSCLLPKSGSQKAMRLQITLYDLLISRNSLYSRCSASLFHFKVSVQNAGKNTYHINYNIQLIPSIRLTNPPVYTTLHTSIFFCSTDLRYICIFHHQLSQSFFVTLLLVTKHQRQQRQDHDVATYVSNIRNRHWTHVCLHINLRSKYNEMCSGFQSSGHFFNWIFFGFLLDVVVTA